MKSISFRQILTLLFTLLTLAVNGLANALPLNGQTTGEISDRFASFFVPAGYVFSIWGLIYLGLIAFSIFQALPAQRDDELLKKIAPAYWLSSIANAVWIVLWHYEFFPLTLVVMLALLATLLHIYRQLSEGRPNFDTKRTWLIQLPFSVYLGWVSVATIANFSQVLFYLRWGGWGIPPELWAAFMLAVAVILGLLMRWRENDIAYVLVLIWAFVGIALQQAAAPLVANAAWVAAMVSALGIFAIPALRKGSAAQG